MNANFFNEPVNKGDTVLIIELHPSAPDAENVKALGRLGRVSNVYGERYCMANEILVHGLDTYVRKWIKMEFVG